jgi:PilZ domain
MMQLICPQCSMEYVIRARRQTIAERFFGLLYIYPFLCQLCGYRFKTLDWGIRAVSIEEDSRDYQRLRRNFPFTMVCDGTTVTGWVCEIFTNGCILQAQTPMRLGQTIGLELQIPNLHDPIVIDAAVVRNTTGERSRLEFLRLRLPERRRLQSFIRNELSRDELKDTQMDETLSAAAYAGRNKQGCDEVSALT